MVVRGGKGDMGEIFFKKKPRYLDIGLKVPVL